jgi:hypothetical protein
MGPSSRALWAYLGQAWPGVSLLLCPVDDRRSVVEVGSSRTAAVPCTHDVVPPYRTRAIVFEETMMITTRPWWRVLVGGEAW